MTQVAIELAFSLQVLAVQQNPFTETLAIRSSRNASQLSLLLSQLNGALDSSVGSIPLVDFQLFRLE